MCKLILDRGNFAEFTSVSNVFIDEYMPKANGEFIKIYLHLLRLVDSGNNASSQELSTEIIADKFNVLESDVIRALHYWADQGLLSLSFNDRNEITGITLESAFRNRYFVKGIMQKGNLTNAQAHKAIQSDMNEDILAKVSGENISLPVPESSGTVIPTKKKYTAKEISSFANDDRIKQLTFLAQTYLGKTLNSSDINCILYMVDGLGLDTELIEYIMESCISNDHKSLSYMENQAVNYVKKGITTVSEAKTEEKLKRSIFKSIYKIFGTEPKAPIKKEIDYVIKWSDSYGFPDELILEACNRTMEHTHTGSFRYTDTILTNWFRHNARSMEAIEKLDATHLQEINKTFKPKVSAASRPKKAKSFEQRTYDYDELERKLIANRDKKLAKNKRE